MGMHGKRRSERIRQLISRRKKKQEINRERKINEVLARLDRPLKLTVFSISDLMKQMQQTPKS